MGLRDRLDRALGLGPSDEPRAVTVAARRAATVRPVESTPGARIRVSRDGWDGAIAQVVLLCHRRGLPVEIIQGENAVWLDGVALSATAVRSKIQDGRLGAGGAPRNAPARSMTPPLRELGFVALGGAFGSVSRYAAVWALTRVWPAFPVGTLFVNVLGCFLFGVLAAATPDRGVRAAFGAGVLGGFTTFSAFGGDTLALAQSGATGLAALNAFANLGGGLAAVWAGHALALWALTRGG